MGGRFREPAHPLSPEPSFPGWSVVISPAVRVDSFIPYKGTDVNDHHPLASPVALPCDCPKALSAACQGNLGTPPGPTIRPSGLAGCGATGYSRGVRSRGGAIALAGPGEAANPLERYFSSNVEGPGIWKWNHYFSIYHHHFAKFIGRPVRILESGIYSGGSLGMWQNYFGPHCLVYGVDIEDACRVYETPSMKIFIGDQGDRNFWGRFKREAPYLDIVVDDGGHMTHQQVVTFEETFPHLAPGGVYLCEDVHGEFNPFNNYIYKRSLILHRFDLDDSLALAATPFQRAVASVHFYPFVVVMERSCSPVEFASPMMGSQWQPFDPTSSIVKGTKGSSSG